MDFIGLVVVGGQVRLGRSGQRPAALLILFTMDTHQDQRREAAFSYFRTLTKDQFNREYEDTKGFHGYPDYEKYAPEWIGRRKKEETDRKEAEQLATDEKRHRESSEQAARQHEQQIEHDRSLHRSTQRVAWIAIAVSVASFGIALIALFHTPPSPPSVLSPPPNTPLLPNSAVLHPPPEPSATSPGDALPPTPPSPTTPEPTQEPQADASQEGAKPPDR